MKFSTVFNNFRKLKTVSSAEEISIFNRLIALGVVSIVADIVGLAILYLFILFIVQPDTFNGYVGSFISIEGKLLPLIILAVLFLAKNIFQIFLSKYQLKKVFSITSSMADRSFMQGFVGGLQEQRKVSSNERLNAINSVTNSLPTLVIQPILLAISEVIFVVLALAILLFYKPILVIWILLFIVPVALFLIWFSNKKLATHEQFIQEFMPKMYNLISNSVFGFSDIKLMNMENEYLYNYREIRQKLHNERINQIWISNQIPSRLMETAAIFSILITAIYLSQTEVQSAMMVLAFFASVAFRLLPSITRIIGAISTFNSFASIIDFVSIKRNEVVQDVGVDFRFNQKIELNQLNYRFGEGRQVINNVSETFKKGDFVGIFGPSGEGKTTLVNLLLGFYKPENNESIKIDGHPLNQISRSWQNQLGYVKQDVFLLNETISKNIVFKNEEINEAKLTNILKEVQLFDWVNQLPHKADTKVGELGNQISGGQKQRIAIARALYRNASIFIFDEATNALDEFSKNEVLQTIKKLHLQGHTIIMVSHDTTVLKMADRQFEMKDGNLINTSI
ncbi:MAG: ATP-binding cassette domain-containing protein [Bacteroidia bacterium]